MSSSRRYIQANEQYTENKLMQFALSYHDAFWSHQATITQYISLKQNIHIMRLS